MMKLKETLRSLLCLVAVGCALSGCVEEYEADIAAEDSNQLVVEGTICSSRLNTFFLSRTQPVNAEDAPRMVTGAKVSVRGSDGSEYAATQAADGYYVCLLGSLDADVDYYLHIETDGEVYESSPQKPLPTVKIADIQAVQNTPEDNIDVLITTAEPFDAGQANYYSWTYDETWQVYPDYRTAIYYDTELKEPVYMDIYHFPRCGWVDGVSSSIMIGSSTGYDGHRIRNMKIYDIGRDNVRVYHRYSGLVHQRAISKAEYEYELARRQAGSEMGGLFTPLPSALPTNIHCLTSGKRAIGFVGCSLNTNEYRFFVNASEYSIRKPSGADTRVWLDEPTAEDCCKMVEKGMYLCEWVIPEQAPDLKLHAAWASLSQLDVRYRYQGAYIEEPDFWSLDENVSY